MALTGALLFVVAAAPCEGGFNTGLGGRWYAVKDVPLGRGGNEHLRLPPTRCSALRLWLTQPSSSLGISVRDVVALGPDNQTIPIAEAVAVPSRQAHGVNHAIDANRDTYWACDWTPGLVPWLEVHLKRSVTVHAVVVRWGKQFASMYRVDVLGSCQPTAAMRARGLSDCEAQAPRPYEVLVRTTAMNLMQRGYVANVQRLHARLGARLTLLVDLTLCSGLACDADWLADDLGVAVFGYTALDLASQWPKVRWSDQLSLPTIANSSWGLDWLVRRMDRTLFRAGHVLWPWRDAEHRNISIQAHSLATMMVPWLVHEPSVVFWWLRQRTRQRLTRSNRTVCV